MYKPWFNKGTDASDEDGEYPRPRESDTPSPEEIKLATEILVFIEHDIGADIHRIRIRARGTSIYIYGIVESQKIKKEIEESVPQRPGVSELTCQLSVQD